MLIHYYEFSCDSCKQVKYEVAERGMTKAKAVAKFRKQDGILTRGGLVFCDKDCRSKFYEREKKKKI